MGNRAHVSFVKVLVICWLPTVVTFLVLMMCFLFAS